MFERRAFLIASASQVTPDSQNEAVNALLSWQVCFNPSKFCVDTSCQLHEAEGEGKSANVDKHDR